VLHVMKDTHPLVLGDAVTIGHGVILHGCTIESNVLIGMGSILLNGAKIGSGSIGRRRHPCSGRCRRAAGQPLHGPSRKIAPRALTPEDQASIEAYAARYIEYSETYKAEKV